MSLLRAIKDATTPKWYWLGNCLSCNSRVIIYDRRGFISLARALWPYFVKFGHFGAKVYNNFGKFLTLYFLFGKILIILWQVCDIIGLFFIAANGQILKNNLTTWSHWARGPRSDELTWRHILAHSFSLTSTITVSLFCNLNPDSLTKKPV